MAYSRRGLGIGLTALGGAAAAFGVWGIIYELQCPGWFCGPSYVVAPIVGYLVPGLVILVSGLFFLVTSRKKPLVSDPWSSHS